MAALMAHEPATAAVPPTLGVLLAGGQAKRMGGGDKCLKTLNGQTLLEFVIARARPQCADLILNANGDPKRFDAFGLEVVNDLVPGYGGPLVGVLTGLVHCKRYHPGVEWIVTIATDTPFFPSDLVQRLHEARLEANTPLACATSDRAHPVFGLWPVALLDDLRQGIVHDEVRKVDLWTAKHGVAQARFAVHGTFDPFFNVNTPADLDQAAQHLAALAGQDGS